MDRLKLISGTANLQLAKRISQYVGIPLVKAEVKRFRDGETYVRILEHVRGSHVFVIQPTSPHPSDTNNNIMELAIMIDALRRSSAAEIEAIIPYFGYARQDRKAKEREPISAKLIANLITSAGATRVITVDIHSDQVQGFFDIPVDNLTCMNMFIKHIRKLELKKFVVMAPDVGSIKRSQKVAEALGVPLAVIEKRRIIHNESIVANLIGDVNGKDVVIIDDMIDTAGTISGAVNVLPEFGARDAYIFATHAILSGDAGDKLQKSRAKKVIVTDTIEIPEERRFPKLEILSISDILGETIKRIYKGESLHSLR